MDQSYFRFLFQLSRKYKHSGLSKSEKSLAKRNAAIYLLLPWMILTFLKEIFLTSVWPIFLTQLITSIIDTSYLRFSFTIYISSVIDSNSSMDLTLTKPYSVKTVCDDKTVSQVVLGSHGINGSHLSLNKQPKMSACRQKKLSSRMSIS